jgi:hypothetical protein
VSDQSDIPVLTDLIESGIEIKMSDLGLDHSPQIESVDQFDDATEIDIFNDAAPIDITAPDFGAVDPSADTPELEKIIRQILDEHMEQAWQDIKLAIKHHLRKS